MDGRPPEVTDTASGETLKLACMACIRGHRTKHCGSHNCRDKILWTIKRPGRPSNSCMCKFSGTGRCKCVLAKAQCPHKPKKGEKKTVDCRCDERGRLCCTLSAPQWEMLARGERPRVRMYRNLEELHAGLANWTIAPLPNGGDSLMHGQSPMSAPRTPAASVGGFTNESGGSTPQTPMAVLHHPARVAQAPSLPQSPAGPPRTRFGMMGLGAPMGNDGHVGQDALAWQGQTPVAPAPRPAYETPSVYPNGVSHIQTALPIPSDLSNAAMAYTFDNSISHPPPFSPEHHKADLHSHLQTPFNQAQPMRPLTQNAFDAVPPVTASLHDLTVAPNGALPALTSFDMEYFNFQFPGAICQQCGMADCTCRSCPTVLQNTMDGSWRQCCSRKHVHAGSALVNAQAAPSTTKSCCSSKATIPPPNEVKPSVTRENGGCCGGSTSQPEFDPDPFDFSTEPVSQPHLQDQSLYQQQPDSFTFDPQVGPPLPHTHPQEAPSLDQSFSALNYNHESSSHQALESAWTEPETFDDMDFDEFLEGLGDADGDGGGCGCGTECPCGVDDSFEMDLDGGEPEDEGGDGAKKGGCCGGGH